MISGSNVQEVFFFLSSSFSKISRVPMPDNGIVATSLCRVVAFRKHSLKDVSSICLLYLI